MKNHVIGPYLAVVDGQETGLAGCNNTECGWHCLRKDARLKLRKAFSRSEFSCRLFIPADEQKK